MTMRLPAAAAVVAFVHLLQASTSAKGLCFMLPD